MKPETVGLRSSPLGVEHHQMDWQQGEQTYGKQDCRKLGGSFMWKSAKDHPEDYAPSLQELAAGLTVGPGVVKLGACQGIW